jgi:flagellar hook-basal body complex protein FliE
MALQNQPLAYGQLPHLPQIPGLSGQVSQNLGLEGISFGQTLGNVLNKANSVMGEPEKLTIRAVNTGDVDIHEVMIAMGKSEVAFKLISSITQKVVGAFDKLTSMQV